MNCDRPFVMDGNAYGCGQCVPCRKRKRLEWVHRMMLEASLYKDNAFVTLTFDKEGLPDDLSVSPRELSLFIKRLRKGGSKFRYFACGEYGDSTLRPHYHLALFSFPTCAFGITRKKEYCCAVCSEVSRAWGKGIIQCATLEAKSIAYVAGYVSKKMTRDSDPRLKGRRPEFARMSLRPGIGYNVMHEVAHSLMEYDLDKKMIDVPCSLRHGKIELPLGRYLRRNLRSMIGRDKNEPAEAAEERKKELQPLRQAAYDASISFKDAVLEKSLGRRIQIHAAEKRKKGKRL